MCSFGIGSVIAFPTATLYGEGQIHLGAGTMVSTWCTLAAGYSPDQDTVPPRALVIGDRCVIGMRSGIVAHESIEIGDDVVIASGVSILDHDHRTHVSDGHLVVENLEFTTAPIRIGSNVWLGDKVTVLKGVTIGDDVIVAANAVVTKDVPSGTVVGGIPATVIRRIDLD